MSAICLVSGIHGQDIPTTVANAISVSSANLDIAIQAVNNTINLADQTILTAWNQFGQSMVDLYNSYYNRLSNYTTVDLSVFATAISSIQNTISYTPVPIQDYPISQLFSSVKSSAQQAADILSSAAASINTAVCGSCTAKKLDNCKNKFGARLGVSPITIDRVTDCVSAEQTRFTNIGSNVAAQYNNVLTSATNYLAVLNVCDTPAAEVLNNPAPGQRISTQCLSDFLQNVNSLTIGVFVADSMRNYQTELVTYRMERCSKLVGLDIQDRTTKVLDDFSNCLG
ncbi:uncharacterized protein LOC134214252 [Armigeres subalbatus]|uniref:uncharacterized protein LOC134214252 n=1 Tax=Armigeres subalbatus TaxID=124917 RepID=UPI002ED3DB85